jgi:hypothetical protein
MPLHLWGLFREARDFVEGLSYTEHSLGQPSRRNPVPGMNLARRESRPDGDRYQTKPG